MKIRFRISVSTLVLPHESGNDYWEDTNDLLRNYTEIQVDRSFNEHILATRTRKLQMVGFVLVAAASSANDKSLSKSPMLDRTSSMGTVVGHHSEV